MREEVEGEKRKQRAKKAERLGYNLVGGPGGLQPSDNTTVSTVQNGTTHHNLMFPLKGTRGRCLTYLSLVKYISMAWDTVRTLSYWAQTERGAHISDHHICHLCMHQQPMT